MKNEQVDAVIESIRDDFPAPLMRRGFWLGIGACWALLAVELVALLAALLFGTEPLRIFLR